MGRFGNHFHGQVANTADMLLFKNVKRKFKKEEDSVSGKRTVHIHIIRVSNKGPENLKT